MKKSIAVAFAVACGLAQADTYAIDPNHTFVNFEIGHFNTSTNRGRFDKSSGTVEFDRAAKSGKVDITIEIASINTGMPQLAKDIRGSEVLDAAKYPQARFVSDTFAFAGDKVSEVAGMLTLHGKTLPVTLKATNFNCYQNPLLKREVCGGDFETTLQRSLWGVDYGLKYGFPDAMRIIVQVEAIKQ